MIRLSVLDVKKDEFEKLVKAVKTYGFGVVDDERRWLDIFIGEIGISVFPIKTYEELKAQHEKYNADL